MGRWKGGIRLIPLINKDINPPHWMWMGAVSPTTGYGCARGNKQQMTSAHRAVWELIFGDVPNDLNVCHKCDIKLCVNPECMFIGTQADNIEDARVKGRLSGGPKTGQSGRRNNNSKYTDEQIMEVISLFNEGFAQRDIARMTDVHYASVWYIIRRQNHDANAPKVISEFSAGRI